MQFIYLMINHLLFTITFSPFSLHQDVLRHSHSSLKLRHSHFSLKLQGYIHFNYCMWKFIWMQWLNSFNENLCLYHHPFSPTRCLISYICEHVSFGPQASMISIVANILEAPYSYIQNSQEIRQKYTVDWEFFAS